MKNLFPIILLFSVLQMPLASAMDQAERAGMKLIKPGLWINASNRTVYVSARATEIQGGEPCEFILIGAESGHGYESLFSTKLLPSEIQAALEQIGLPAGSPTDGSLYRFWPRGERVTYKVHYAPPGGRPLQSHPPENFIIHANSQQPLAQQTWTFTGCLTQDNACLADHDLQAVVSTYNEPYSIFCPPRREGKAEVYGSLLRNKKNLLPEDHPVMLSITPEVRPSDSPRTLNAGLNFYPEAGKLAYRISRDTPMKLTHQGHKPGGWVKWFKENITALQDWHVNVTFDPKLPLETIHLLSATLKQVEGDNGLRIAAPSKGQLYYKSFIPSPALRERSGRPHQPIELHLRRYAKNYTSTLMLLKEEWSIENNQFEITETAFKAPSPKALKYLLDKHHFPSDVAFIYCSADTSLGDLQVFAGPLLEEVNVVYVFLSPAEKDDE